MRDEFFSVLSNMVKSDSKGYLFTANLGFKLFDDFRTNNPDNFIDVGVAEANMIGIAAGMALSGKSVYCYSIIPFLLMRAYEQIRVDIDYHNLPVTLVGVGGGFTYGLEGYTHYGLEDFSLMRSLPNMNIVVPANQEEAECVARISYNHNAPLYIRLGREISKSNSGNKLKFEIGKGIVLREGKDVLMVAVGNMVKQSELACDLLASKNISSTLINMHTLKPLDVDIIKEYFSCKSIFTVEEHFVVGGLGSSVAEVLSESSYSGLFKRIGIPLKSKNIIGKPEFLREKYGLTAQGICNTILTSLQNK